jgi:uncharacterized damage-inducible protein DinB
MFRTIGDFERDWTYERESTLKVFRQLRDEVLDQRVTPDGRTLGRLAWHLTQTHGELLGHAGLTVDAPREDSAVPARAADLVAAYERSSQSVLDQVRRQWTDATLLQEDEMYGERWTRGFTLLALIKHEAHHRGQMTVLMRQAGLAVPGVYGPAREEWAALGAPPMA